MPVLFFNQSVVLHSVWDTHIIVMWDDDVDDAISQLEDIMENDPAIVAKYQKDMNPLDWANESFDFVRTTVYNFTKNSEGGTIAAIL